MEKSREKSNYGMVPFIPGIGVTNYSIVNIMASSDLNTSLDLKQVSDKLTNCEYNPENFPGVIWRPKNGYGVVVIMDDGRMMCTNARSIDEVENLFDILNKEMESRGLITPRLSCPKCGAAVEEEDVVCIECGHLLQEGS